MACRAAYNSFVPYHNFRHVVDVLQATFNFLVHIGSIKPYPGTKDGQRTIQAGRSPMASLITPFEALTLLVTAIGHDVGHPGVNNGFLVTLNAPLAQLYNDRSVLESFHCAAYSQILRRYWPSAFEDSKMRNLMISSILATDMGLHFDYMKRLGDIQEKLQVNNTTEGWNGRQIEEQRALACSLLIKCADISNTVCPTIEEALKAVFALLTLLPKQARRHDAALRWMHILSEEFSRQASMEGELDIPSSLMAPPKKDLGSLVKSQLSFMNLFAIPLFQGVADIMPGMKYTVEELEINKGFFERMVDEEKIKEAQEAKDDPARRRLLKEGTLSPRTMSYAVGMEENKDSTSHHDDKPGKPFEGISEVLASTPTSLVDGEGARKPAHIPQTNEEYREVNGNVSQLINSDPFHSHGQGSISKTDDNSVSLARQRCSETTEGSTSQGLAADWVSQATSTTGGRIPKSPSTKGTSIVSKESADRPTSAPGPEVRPRSALLQPPPIANIGELKEYETSGSARSLGKPEGKSLRKKSSRFRIKELPFFRRHKSSNQQTQTADANS